MQKTNVFNKAGKGEKISVLDEGESSNTPIKKRGRPRKVLITVPTNTSKDEKQQIIPNADTAVLKENTPEASGDRSANEGKRPRGRPRIHPIDENKVKKPRGRPKKEQSSLAFAGRQLLHDVRLDRSESDGALPLKRGPGRPRKPVTTEQSSDGSPGVKRKPGRPRKLPETPVTSFSATKVKRGPGRPRKADVSSSKEDIPASLVLPDINTAVKNEGRNVQTVKMANSNTDDAVAHRPLVKQVEIVSPMRERSAPTKGDNTRQPTIVRNNGILRAKGQRLSSSGHTNTEPTTRSERLTRSAGGEYEDKYLKETPNKRQRFHSDTYRELEVDKKEVRGELLLLGNPTIHTESPQKASIEAQELRSSIEPSSDATNVTESPRSSIDLTFSAGTQTLGPRSSSSTSNEGIAEHSVKDQLKLGIRENESSAYSSKKKRRLKKTGAVILDEDVLKEYSNIVDKPSQSDVSNKSIVLDFGRNIPFSSRPKSKDDNIARNNILDDSYDAFEFSNHGNSGFIIPMDAFKSPRKKKTITPTETEKKSNGILGVLKNTAQTLQNISRTPRHISIGQHKNVLDDIDTNIELSEDESEYSSSSSTPIQSPRRSPNLRPLQSVHDIMTPVTRKEWEPVQPRATPTKSYASSSPRHASNSMTGAQVKITTDKLPRIQKLSAGKNMLLLDNFQLDDHGTPETSNIDGSNNRKSSIEIDIPAPDERLPVWKGLQSSCFSSLEKDRRMLSKFLHELLRYVNINEADLSNDIDGNLNYFIQQMPEKELDMKFSEWLDYKVGALKDEYVKDIERKKDILLERFKASEEMVRNITDSSVLLELASRFGINYY